MAGTPHSEVGSSKQALAVSLAAGIAIGAGTVAALGLFISTRRREGGSPGDLCDMRRFALPAAKCKSRPSTDESWHESDDLQSPLPPDVVRLLESSRLCFLSTLCDDHPHLSVMNFTYCASEGNVIIMSTRRDTKKFKLVQSACNVAILVLDFPSTGPEDDSSGGVKGSYSSPTQNRKVTITLNGSASIQEGALAEKYRALHAKNNPDSKTFIVGENIAIITVRVKSARICDVQDEVTLWDLATSAGK